MKTNGKYPLCERNGLLRKLDGGKIVVSSTALHFHLGFDEYAKFIASIERPNKEPGMGFWPETVEAFLNGK